MKNKTKKPVYAYHISNESEANKQSIIIPRVKLSYNCNEQWISCTEIATDRQTARQTDIQTDRQPASQPARQTDRQTDRQPDSQTDGRTNRQGDWQKGGGAVENYPHIPLHIINAINGSKIKSVLVFILEIESSFKLDPTFFSA